MLNDRELGRMRWRITGYLVLALVLTAIGASSNVMISDMAYTASVLMVVGMTVWVTRWAHSSRLVRWLTVSAMILLSFTQVLDITENFHTLRDLPVLGSESYWNGRLGSLSFLAGLVITFAALMFALVEAWLGRIAQDNYQLLAEHVSDVITISNLEWKFTYVSPSVEKLRGFTVEETLAQSPEEYLARSSAASYRELLQSELSRVEQGLREAGEVTTLDVEYTRKDGTAVWVEIRMRFLCGKDGRPYGVLGVSRDISERKRTEDELRRLNSRLTLAIQSGNLGVWEWDLASDRVLWDERMYEIHGVDGEQSIWSFESWRKAVHPDDLEGVQQVLREALSNGQTCHSRFRIVRPGGEIRHIDAWGAVRFDEAGAAQALIGVNADITEHLAAENQRRGLEEQLHQAQKLESVGRLAGGVAHDFNNMLLVIIGHADMASACLSLDDALEGHIESIRGAALRSAELTRQLLAFARQQVVTPRVIDMNQATAGMVKMLERLIGEHIDLLWKPGEALWPVRIDPTQADQILVNFCVNARDAISGRGEIIIETSNVTVDRVTHYPQGAQAPGDYVRLMVRDSGSGMDRETQRRVFEPFFTTKEVGRGTGLGLSTVYGIAKQNGGLVTVSSEPGRGTTFTIDLPRYQGASTEVATHTVAFPVAKGHETILLVEDEIAMLGVAQGMLEQLGYTVLPASTPDEALRIASTYPERIHLAITDVILPDMDGRVLAERLVACVVGLRPLFMSGYINDFFNSDSAHLLNAENFIGKPFGMDELGAKVREVLDEVAAPSSTGPRSL